MLRNGVQNPCESRPVSLFLADLDNNYRNEIEMDKKIIVYVIWNIYIYELYCPESRRNHSLTSKCRFKTAKIHELHYVLELKTRGSCVSVSLIPGRSGKEI